MFSHRRGSCELVADLLATWPISLQQVVVMEFGIQHDTTDTMHFSRPACYGLVIYVADLLWTCYGEVANLLRTCYRKTGFSSHPA